MPMHHSAFSSLLLQVLVVPGAENRHRESLDVAALRKAIENAVERQPPRRRR